MDTQLKEKEAVIKALKTESDELRNRIKNLTNEVQQLKVGVYPSM